MALTAKPSYQRLKQELWFDEEGDIKVDIPTFRNSRPRRFHVRRRFKVKIPSLKRLLVRKTRLVKFAWNKVCKRLKESRSHFGDLFAGNYLFMQVTPTPLKQCGEINSKDFVIKGRDQFHHGLSSVAKIA